MDKTNERFNIEVGERLIARRKMLGYTQAKVASLAGTLTRGHLSLVERGATAITARALVGLCKALNISPNDLLGVDDSAGSERTDRVSAQIISDSSSVEGFRLAEEEGLFLSLFKFVSELGSEKVRVIASEVGIKALRRADVGKIKSLLEILK